MPKNHCIKLLFLYLAAAAAQLAHGPIKLWTRSRSVEREVACASLIQGVGRKENKLTLGSFECIKHAEIFNCNKNDTNIIS